jgi:hypothetical protein
MTEQSYSSTNLNSTLDTDERSVSFLAATMENLKKHHLVGVPIKIQTRYFPNTSQKHYHLRKHPSGHSRENSDHPVDGRRCKWLYEIQLTEIYFKDSCWFELVLENPKDIS